MVQPITALSTIVWLVLHSSCHSTQGPKQEEDVKSIVFQTGFPLSRPLSGVYTDRISDQQRVYFADPVTYKEIRCFTDSGTPTDTIPLTFALARTGHIGGMTIVHPDTIILTGLYTNQVLFIDRHGLVYRELDLTEQLRTSDGLQYELWHSGSSPFILGDNACFEIELVGSSISAFMGDMSWGRDDQFKYYSLAQAGPAHVVVDLKAAEPEVQLGPTSALTKDSVLMLAPEVGTYACLNGKWLDFSAYDDQVTQLDPADGKPMRRFLIRSSVTRTAIPGIRCIRGQAMDLQDSLDDRSGDGGCIQSIHFAPSTMHYLVCVLHPQDPQDHGDSHQPVKHYSVIELDTAFKHLHESIFTDGKLVVPFMLNLAQGSFALRWETKREKMSGVHTFEKLDLDGR